jgi:hypothetical protein
MSELRKIESPPQEQFNRLADADRERLVAALEQVPPQLLIRPFAYAVAERAAADPKFVEALCFFLAEWFTLLNENSDHYLERIVDYLAVPPEGQSGPSQEFAALRSQWRRVMQADVTLGATLKAFEILRRQANSYDKAVMTTEIRPVYLTDPTKPPTHAILLHQLHITYHTEYGKQTSHIAMDSHSIAALINVLQRAITKEQTLVEQDAYHYLGKEPNAKQ